nr:hypothetical protein [Tanacetum cinerariifolium]
MKASRKRDPCAGRKNGTMSKGYYHTMHMTSTMPKDHPRREKLKRRTEQNMSPFHRRRSYGRSDTNAREHGIEPLVLAKDDAYPPTIEGDELPPRDQTRRSPKEMNRTYMDPPSPRDMNRLAHAFLPTERGDYTEGMMSCRGRTQLDAGEHGRTVGLADERHLSSKKTDQTTHVLSFGSRKRTKQLMFFFSGDGTNLLKQISVGLVLTPLENHSSSSRA